MSDPQTELVPLKEAAARLAVSVDTVRRRLRAGELQGERRKTPQGFIWEVAVPVREEPEPVAQAETAPPVDDGLALKVAVLEERLAGVERLLEEVRAERDDWKQQASTQAQAMQALGVFVAQGIPASTGDEAGDRREPIDVVTKPAPPARKRNPLARAWDGLRGR